MSSFRETKVFEAVFLSREGIHRVFMKPHGSCILGSSWREGRGLLPDLGSEAPSVLAPALLAASQFKALFPGFHLQPQRVVSREFESLGLESDIPNVAKHKV